MDAAAEPSSLTIEPGIRRKRKRNVIEAYVNIKGQYLSRYFPPETPLEEIRAWRKHSKRTGLFSWLLPTVRVPMRADQGGYIYFVQLGNHVKIGKTKDIERRLSELQTAHHEPLRLVAYEYATQPGKIEALIHREYAKHRAKNGEWFRLSNDIARLIQAKAELCVMALRGSKRS